MTHRGMYSTSFTLTPSYLVRYPEIAKAAGAVGPLITDLRGMCRTVSPDHTIELEARLGRIQMHRNRSPRFSPGVSNDYMHKILQMMGTFPEWYRVDDWVHEQDFIYPNDHGDSVRSRVIFDKHGQSMKVEHVKKRRRQVQDLKNTMHAQEDDGMYRNAWDVRISLSTEEPVQIEDLPPTIHPSFVRVKNRKSFWYRPSTFEEAVWRFDLTVAWEGETKSEAEQKQRMEPGRFEIECEMVDPAAYLSAESHDDLYVATSLLLKIRDLLGREGMYVLEPFQTRR